MPDESCGTFEGMVQILREFGMVQSFALCRTPCLALKRTGFKARLRI